MAENLATTTGTITVLKRELEWLKKHAEYKVGGWFCRHSGKEIIMIPVVHSIHEDGSSMSGNKTETVFHLYCPNCETEPNFQPNSPVERDELTEVKNG